ncbi:hypothetical protein MYX65_01695 [Acidobacteria bacterium AH-259-L09]|nr:hypothetical protein [Acidobacteria bacterium AH-259-L09]
MNIKTKGIVIVAAMILIFPLAVLGGQFSATTQKAKNSTAAGNRKFSGKAIATGKAELAKDIVIRAGSSTVAETSLLIKFTAEIANTGTTGITIVVDTTGGNWNTTPPSFGAGDIDDDDGEIFLTVPAGTAGEQFRLRGVRLEANKESGEITAEIIPEFNSIIVDGLPARVVKVITAIKDGLKVETDDPADVLESGIVVDGGGAGQPGDGATILISEALDDVFKSEDEAEGEANAGETGSGVEIKVTLDTLPSGLELGLAIASNNTVTDPLLSDTLLKGSETSFTITFVDDDADGKATDMGNDEELTLTVTTSKVPASLPVGTIDFTFTLSPDSGIPSFVAKTITVAVINILPGSTNLLWPFASRDVAEQFDSGLYVSNTTADTPFGANGAADQSGGGTFYLWPNDGSASFSVTVDALCAAGFNTGLSAACKIDAGGMYTVLLSEILKTAGVETSTAFYIIGVFKFTHAHGGGFVFGPNFTQNINAYVIPAVETEPRSIQAVEQLVH